jgi:hypothetical protein
VGEDELAEADQNELLAEHVRTLGDWYKAADNRGTDPHLADLFGRKAQEAEDAYRRSRNIGRDRGRA